MEGTDAYHVMARSCLVVVSRFADFYVAVKNFINKVRFNFKKPCEFQVYVCNTCMVLYKELL